MASAGSQSGSNGLFTVAPVAPAESLPAEFATISTICRAFGIGRTLVFRHIKEKRIRSVHVREPGKQKGRRLIEIASVRNYLYAEMERENRQGGSS